MAPDLNALSAGEKWDYSTPGSSGYDIPDITYNDPKNRKLRVLTIGAGFSGILMAYQIQKYCENVEHVIYEKNYDIGGTWLENRYPVCSFPRVVKYRSLSQFVRVAPATSQAMRTRTTSR